MPAGAYKGAVHVRIDWRDGASQIQTDMFFVEKVGLVKMTQSLDGKLSTMELVEMKPVK